MEYKSVESSTIKVIGYDAAAKLLEITFNSGATYQYAGVPKDIADSLLNADSKGSYFSIWIRASYPCERLHAETCGKYLDCHIPNCECFCHKVRRDVTNGQKQTGTNSQNESTVQQSKGAKGKAKAKKGRQAV